jgi:hypothetical protein
MLSNVRFVVVLGVLTMRPCFSDVVSLSVNGSVSGTGEVGYETMSSGFQGNSFTLSGTNTSLGSFSTSGGASFTLKPFGFTNSLNVVADQDTVAFSNLIELATVTTQTPGGDLSVGGSLGISSFWSAQVDSDLSTSFNLTVESVVTLSANELGLSTGELRDSMGDVLATFTNSSPLTMSLTLAPGSYTLEQNSKDGASASGASSPQMQVNVLAGIFQPVPEPRGAAVVGTLMVLFALIVSRRRRRTAQR